MILDRILSEVPAFFRKVQIVAGTIAGIGGAILLAPATLGISLAPVVMTAAGYAVAIGSAVAGTCQLPKRSE